MRPYVFNLAKYFFDMHKYAFVSKSLKVKFVFVGDVSVLMLNYDFIKYDKYAYENISKFL